MIDKGVICRGKFRGREVLGVKLNWHKRYITLGPVATVLGLAFKMYDPDHLYSQVDDLGITLALVPTNTPGVVIGRRHLPAYQGFQNGPNWGHDVFLPLEYIIGGPARIGQGWKMLMSALAAGRGISLPSQSAAGVAVAARTAGAYARIREQFNIPIGKFEGIEEPLARIAGAAYLVDGARRFTCAGLDQGHHPAVISGIMKLHATDRMRAAVTDAMDIHGGKAIMDGPNNYLGNIYRSIPVGITVEGANILTRNLIVFGQGAIRAHPYLLEEINALGDPDKEKALDRFDKVLWSHIRHSLATFARAFVRSWTGGLISPAPDAGSATNFYRQLSRYAAAFALTSDMALLTLGGTLKRKEMLSARLGDILSELYLLSGALKRWEDEGRQQTDVPLLEWCMEKGFATIQLRFAEIFGNLPNRPVSWLLHAAIQPFGVRRHGPADGLSQRCAQILLEPSEARERLTAGIFHKDDDGGLARLERAFKLVSAAEPVVKKMHNAEIRNWRMAKDRGIISDIESKQLETMYEAVSKVIDVDDFAPEALSPLYKKSMKNNSRPSRKRSAVG